MSKLEAAPDATYPYPMPQFVQPDVSREQLSELQVSVLAALVYADLFDYPLTLDEVVKYQVGTDFGAHEIAGALGSPALQSRVTSDGTFFSLGGREDVVATRTARSAVSERLWGRARVYSRWLARLPYVRMVAVTGALAVDNIGELPDIDFLVVAEHERVWRCRRALILLVRVAKLFGDELCPNYIISDRQLRLDQQDFFTAHELSQMVPLLGDTFYREMLSANDWARKYLPKGFESANGSAAGPVSKPWQSVPEAVFKGPGTRRWERWELERLRRKLRAANGESAEVVCTPEQCKGHTGFHRSRITARYRDRLRELGLEGHMAPVLKKDFKYLDSV